MGFAAFLLPVFRFSFDRFTRSGDSGTAFVSFIGDIALSDEVDEFVDIDNAE